MSIDIGIDRKGRSLRMLVSQALGLYKTNSLLAFLHDPNAIVRSAAARHLQTRGDPEVFERAIELAQSKRRDDREIAAFLLGQLGTPLQPFKGKSVPVLEKLCGDRAYVVRIAALAALGHLRATQSEEVIRHARRDAHPEVRSMANYVLKQCQG